MVFRADASFSLVKLVELAIHPGYVSHLISTSQSPSSGRGICAQLLSLRQRNSVVSHLLWYRCSPLDTSAGLLCRLDSRSYTALTHSHKSSKGSSRVPLEKKEGHGYCVLCLFTYTNLGNIGSRNIILESGWLGEFVSAQNSEMSVMVQLRYHCCENQHYSDTSRLCLPISIHIAGSSLVHCLIGGLSREGGVTSGYFQG